MFALFKLTHDLAVDRRKILGYISHTLLVRGAFRKAF
jgi:hypothetical protein